MIKIETIPDRLDHFIGGAFTQGSGQTFANVNPATEETICQVALGGSEEIAAAVTAAKAALINPDWADLGRTGRAALLKKIAAVVETHRHELARLESLDTGKPYYETYEGDIVRVAKNFDFFADAILHEEWSTFENPDGSWHTTVREPVGVVGSITPWNLPLYLATWKMAPALAMGNTMVLKPAEWTPLTATAFAHILNEVGVPPGVVNIVHGNGPQSAGQALVEHPDVRAITFTGETRTGEVIMAAAAPHLKKLSFEMGGKGATLVMDDADLDRACEGAVQAAFRNQGQICLAGSRLLVHEKVADEFLERLVARAAQIKIGDPLDPETRLGSLIHSEHYEKVMGFVDYAKTQGYRFACGGKRPAHLAKGCYLEPTIIAGVSQDSRLVQEEIFGPVMTYQTFKDADEGIAMLNGTPYGLSCSVWTENVGQARHLSAKMRMGLVWVNTWFNRNLHAAFGGMKRSGIGREGGRYSLDFYSEQKTITMNS